VLQQHQTDDRQRPAPELQPQPKQSIHLNKSTLDVSIATASILPQLTNLTLLQAAALTMARKSAAFNAAPPIRPPSMSAMASKLLRIVRLHAAAVQDTHLGGRLGTLGPRRTQHGMHFLRHFRRGRLAGANGPDRLVGHDARRVLNASAASTTSS
jgi:hypothetical protein